MWDLFVLAVIIYDAKNLNISRSNGRGEEVGGRNILLKIDAPQNRKTWRKKNQNCSTGMSFHRNFQPFTKKLQQCNICDTVFPAFALEPHNRER